MIVDQLVDTAMRKAQGAQATVVQKEAVEVAFENDALKSAESSQSTEISVKVIVDGQLGTSQTTDIRDLDGVVARAIEVAAFGNMCPYVFPSQQPGSPVRVFDEALLSFGKAEMIQIGRDMQAAIKAYNPALAFRGSLTKSVSSKAFANSSGAQFTEESTSFDLYGLGLRVRENELFEAWHGHKGRQRTVDHLAIADRVVDMLRNAMEDATDRSGTMPVIFAPSAMDVLLLPLRLSLDGKHVHTGYSSMGGRIGQCITDARFSLTDHPLIDYAPHSSTYDDEGVPHRVLPLIEGGVTRNLLYDLDSAARAGARSTGHGEGRDTANLLIRPGLTPYADIVENTKKGLLIYYVMGLGQGNPIGGDFSVGVRVGFKIENGEIAGLLKDVMVSGNTFDALNNVIAISAETEPGFGWYDAAYPYIQVDGLNVVAR